MLDEEDRIPKDGTLEDSVGHGEWRGLTPDRSDVPVQNLEDNAEPAGADASAAGGKPSDDSYLEDIAHDMSAELGLGYRDYGVGSAPAEEEAEE